MFTSGNASIDVHVTSMTSDVSGHKLYTSFDDVTVSLFLSMITESGPSENIVQHNVSECGKAIRLYSCFTER